MDHLIGGWVVGKAPWTVRDCGPWQYKHDPRQAHLDHALSVLPEGGLYFSVKGLDGLSWSRVEARELPSVQPETAPHWSSHHGFVIYRWLALIDSRVKY